MVAGLLHQGTVIVDWAAKQLAGGRLAGVPAPRCRAGTPAAAACLVRRQGYRRVRTDTTHAFKDMLLLNIREGFDVFGAIVDHPVTIT
jgi:hypothetical protein